MGIENAIEMFDMKVGHVGINADGPEQAAAWAEDFLRLLGFPVKDGEKSVWSGKLENSMVLSGENSAAVPFKSEAIKSMPDSPSAAPLIQSSFRVISAACITNLLY